MSFRLIGSCQSLQYTLNTGLPAFPSLRGCSCHAPNRNTHGRKIGGLCLSATVDLSLVGSVPLLNINRFRRGQGKRLVDFCALARGWKASLTVSWREVKVSIVAQIAEQFSQFGRQMHSQNPFLLPSFRTNHPSNYSTSTSKTSRHHSMISGHRLLASSRIVSGKDILDAVRQESRF